MSDAEIKLYASFKRHHKYADKDDPLSITVDGERITLRFDRQRDPEGISLTDSEWEQAVALVNEMRGRRGRLRVPDVWCRICQKNIAKANFAVSQAEAISMHYNIAHPSIGGGKR